VTWLSRRVSNGLTSYFSRRVLTAYVAYYIRSHISGLDKDTSCARPVTPPSVGRMIASPVVG